MLHYIQRYKNKQECSFCPLIFIVLETLAKENLFICMYVCMYKESKGKIKEVKPVYIYRWPDWFLEVLEQYTNQLLEQINLSHFQNSRSVNKNQL